jgi:hypothetical protein
MARRVMEGRSVRRSAGHQRLEQLLGRERGRRRQQRQHDGVPSPQGYPGNYGGGHDPADRERSQCGRQLPGQLELAVAAGAELVLDPCIQARELMGAPDQPGDQGSEEDRDNGHGRRPWRSQRSATRQYEGSPAALSVTAGHGTDWPASCPFDVWTARPSLPLPGGRVPCPAIQLSNRGAGRTMALTPPRGFGDGPSERRPPLPRSPGPGRCPASRAVKTHDRLCSFVSWGRRRGWWCVSVRRCRLPAAPAQA